jgi:hypothetical protein
MPHLTKAIDDALAHGWERKQPKFVLNTTVISNPDLLDPAFFQALGKARGWYNSYHETPPHELEMPMCWCGATNEGVNGELLTVHQDRTWRGAWHRFIDHLAEGKTAEEFFSGLTN